MPEPQTENRLIRERSPYLLKHAHNPVDWYPWGKDAFEKAKSEDKPLFVSIGYASCHWCSVMEKESFEDKEVANILNKYFISVKVDREERPDVDEVYMQACQVLGSNGGWPLNVFLDSEGRPFFAGTYFPKEDRYNMAGFITILNLIANYWEEERKKLLDIGGKVAKIIENRDEPSEIKESWLHEAVDEIKNAFDYAYGGFTGAPKFPMPSTWLFALRYSTEFNDEQMLSLVLKTLDKLAMGGIHDHVEGGFCRYSTDEKWIVPHFEKMLYDNAQLVELYAQAYNLTKNEDYKNICEKTVTYVFRNLMDKDGGFYTSQDADSAGIEGEYYIFSFDEIKQALPYDLFNSFTKVYPVSVDGNFEGKNILWAKVLKENEDIKKSLDLLKQLRKKHVRPALDDKILSGQNGLMISSLAQAGRIFKQDAYIRAAKRAADFVLQNMIQEGRLMTSYRQGLSPVKAVQSDYAYFINGLIELYQATLEEAYLLNAVSLTEGMNQLFFDQKEGGFFLTGKDVNQLYVNVKDQRDGVLPSGNAMAAKVLFVLSRLCAEPEFEQYAIRTLESAAKNIDRSPITYTAHLLVQLYLKAENTEVILIDGDGVDEMKNITREKYSPYVHTILSTEQLKEALTYLHSYEKAQKAAAYVCKNESCSPPIGSAEELSDKLNN